MARRVRGTHLLGAACVLVTVLTATPAAHAGALLDANGCIVEPAVDSRGVLDIDGSVGGSSARLYPFYEWVHDANGSASYVHDPARLHLEVFAHQAATCPRGDGWGGYLPDPTFAAFKVEVTAARSIRIHGMDVTVTNQRAAFLNGASGFTLEVTDGSLEVDTTQFIDESPGPAIPPLTMVATSATTIDMTGDGVADILLPRPAGTPLGISGTATGDVVDLAALDGDACATGGVGMTMGAGDDVVRMPQAPRGTAAPPCGGTVYLGRGDDRFTGGPGDDLVRDERGGALHATFGDGDDILDGEFSYRGNGDSWEIPAGSKRSVIDAGRGHDEIEVPDGHNTIRLGPGDDAAKTGNGGDRVWGGPGDDSIQTGGGDDRALGEAGDDLLADENYDQLPSRFWGDDVLVGGPGRDTLSAGFGSNVVSGGPGNDALRASKGPGTVFAGGGMNSIRVDQTTARIVGGPGSDWIETSSFRGGTISAEGGSDRLWIRFRDAAAGRRTNVSCGAGMDRVVYAPRPHASCERMYACASMPSSEPGVCGRLPWGRLPSGGTSYYWEVPHELIGADEPGPWSHRPARQD